MKKLLTCFLLAAVLVSMSASVRADEAMELHKEGVLLFKDGKYDEAAEAFRKAQVLRPTWKLHYNIGQCEVASKRYGLALDAFEGYLVEGGDDVPDNRREYVSSEIRRIKILVGTLEAEAESGVEIIIDGLPRATMPLMGPLRVASGPHDIVMKKGDEVLFKKRINVAGGMATRISVDKPPVTAPMEETSPPLPAGDEPDEDTAPEEEPETAEEKPAVWKAGLGLTIGGGAVLIGSVFTGITALNKEGELEDVCPNPDNCDPEHKPLRDSAGNLALTTDILIGVGAAAAATGVVLLIVAKKRGKEGQAASSVSFNAAIGSNVARRASTTRFHHAALIRSPSCGCVGPDGMQGHHR